MSKESSAGEAIEPGKAPASANANADSKTESNPCMDVAFHVTGGEGAATRLTSCSASRMDVDHPSAIRIEAKQFEGLLDPSCFLRDLRTELRVEPDGFKPEVFVEVMSPPRLHIKIVDIHRRHDRL